MKLLPKQEELLMSKLEVLRKKYQNLLDTKSSTLPEAHALIEEIKLLEKMLASSETIKKSNSDIIEVGSEFDATIDFFGEIVTDRYILLDSSEKIDENMCIITSKSPLAEAVIGKRENETFKYQVNGKNVTGTIDKIYKYGKVKTIEK